VAHGSSLYGVPWRITAATRHSATLGTSTAELSFSIHACGEYSESGYSEGFRLPFTRAPFLTAGTGTDIDSFPEGDLSGVTSREIASLKLKMSDGGTLSVHPRSAPHRLWRTLPWLRDLRFFDEYFPAGVKPREVVVLDRAGRVLARCRSKRGSFTWAG